MIKSNVKISTKKGLNLNSNIQPLISSHSGITLVALIITIIVMLILVGVSISLAIKGDLFGTAKSGAKQTQIEVYKEQLESIRVTAMMEQIKNHLTILEFLDKVEEGIRANSTFNGSEIKKTAKSVKVTTKEGYVFKITENKVTYMGLASEQGELTLDLTEANTDFIYNPSSWTRGEVRVSIETRVDAEELGAILEYSTDGNTWKEYTTPITLTNNGDKIYARLYSEEEEEVGSVVTGNVSNIDRLLPKQFAVAGTSTDSSITITGSTTDSEKTATDGSSGISKYYYSMDDGQTWKPQNGTVETSYTFNNLPDTTTYDKIKMKAVDNAGNEIVTEAITVATKKVNKPYVGDYVNYVPQSEVTSYNMEAIYSGYSNQTIKQDTSLKWRILNINEDGTIDLISEKPTTSIVYLSGSLGYNNGVYLLNDLCKTLYSNNTYGAVARSIKIEDIQDKMDLSVWDYHDYSTGGVKYGGMATTTYKNIPYQWTQEKSDGNAIDEDLTMGTLTQSEQYELTTDTIVTANSKITMTMTRWDNNLGTNNFKTASTRSSHSDNSMYYNLLKSGNNGEWIASRFTEALTSNSYVGLYKLYSNAHVYSSGLFHMFLSSNNSESNRIRPIVSIPKSYINLATDYETEGTWNLH